MTSAPLWIVWCGDHRLTVQTTTADLARRQCERRLGGCDRVRYAGYAADERSSPMPKGMARRKATRAERVEPQCCGYQVRHALELYDEIRAGFPLRTSGSERQCSDWQLRDFAADIGALLLRHDPDESLDAAMRGDDATCLGAALVLALTLVDCGYSVADALLVANRTRGISVPRV